MSRRRYPPLSDREMGVLNLAYHGFDQSGIAAELDLTDGSVAEAFASLRRKFGGRSRMHVVAIAVQLGVVTLPADHLLDAFRTMGGLR